MIGESRDRPDDWPASPGAFHQGTTAARRAGWQTAGYICRSHPIATRFADVRRAPVARRAGPAAHDPAPARAGAAGRGTRHVAVPAARAANAELLARRQWTPGTALLATARGLHHQRGARYDDAHSGGPRNQPPHQQLPPHPYPPLAAGGSEHLPHPPPPRPPPTPPRPLLRAR